MDQKEEWIDISIRHTKNEMKLQEEQKSLDRHSSSRCKIDDWTVSDVICWLENKQLHKFIFLFQKHHVTGKDLLNLDLPFLEDYEHISMVERESLLSEIYQLLNPRRIYASEEDLTKLKSPVDKKKYFAAIEAAKVKSATLPRSSSVVVLPTHASSSKTSSTRSSPLVKPRHRSESGADNQGKLSHFFSHLPDYKKRKTMSKTSISSSPLPVYQYVQQFGPQCLRCIQLPPLSHGDITLATDTDGQVTLEAVPDSLSHTLHVGDRVLEVNGYVVHPSMKDPAASLKTMMKHKSPATLVVLTKHVQLREDDGMDGKWQQLHSMLEDMRDDPSFVQPDLLETPPHDQQEYLSHTTKLQEEIQTLQEKVLDQQKLRDKLQGELELKDAALHDLELSRDKAMDRLKDSRSYTKNKSTKEYLGGKEYYNMTMNTLNVENASKEEVVESLKEIVMEASKQKWYLDRLISLVIEESPWLLDEVDSEFDNLTLTSDNEEFC